MLMNGVCASVHTYNVAKEGLYYEGPERIFISSRGVEVWCENVFLCVLFISGLYSGYFFFPFGLDIFVTRDFKMAIFDFGYEHSRKNFIFFYEIIFLFRGKSG